MSVNLLKKVRPEMYSTKKINAAEFRDRIPLFAEKTKEFYEGKMNMKDYKGFSGKYGSYAQRGGKANMLRLRMSAGRMTKEKLGFVAEAIKKHNVDLIHFTTCQALQLHNLQPEAVVDIMSDALDADIICYGGGGDYPRNVMCSPLAGTSADEYFDVMLYALAAANFLMQFIDLEKMPRKLKVAFSGSEKNVSHATFRDLGFVATPQGRFDVYAAGGLGNNPRFGTRVAESIDPLDILYYIVAMIHTFRKYGNYDNRAKARTRYMVEALGSEEAFRNAFQAELKEVMDKEDLRLNPEDLEVVETTKKGDKTKVEESFQIRKQKQKGLYSVKWHPQGGSPDLQFFDRLTKLLADMEDVELRLSPDETAWIINLTGKEALQVADLLKDNNARNEFETSISCIGNTICQVGLRDSQGLLKDVMAAVKAANLPDNALPQIHISGCPSSCGTHQVGDLGFRGFLKVIDKKPYPAFLLYVGGNDEQGQEKMGKELGSVLQERIPELVVKIGQAVADSGLSYRQWRNAHPEAIEEIAADYLV